MKAFKPSKDVIVTINAKLLFAFSFGVVSYLIWPTSAKWWGLGVISICLSLGSLGLLKEAIKLVAKSRTFEGDQSEFMAQGKQVKSSTLASNERMTRDGVIKDAK